MNPASLGRLVLMAAIGGGSFLLMRIGAPVLGALPLAEARLLVAAGFLLLVSWWLDRPLRLRSNWRHYAVLGLFSFALPVLLFAFAARTVPASLMAILNATSPIFGAILGAVLARKRPSTRQAAGLLLGAAGVAVLVGIGGVALDPAGVLATLAAALSYALATVFAARARHIDAVENAHGSVWMAVALLAPALALAGDPGAAAAQLHGAAGLRMALVVVLLGVFCTGLAFLLYFRLVSDLGPASALTVTFLVPMFGVLWGHLFLGEAVGWQTLAGAAMVIAGTALSMGLSLSRLGPFLCKGLMALHRPPRRQRQRWRAPTDSGARAP